MIDWNLGDILDAIEPAVPEDAPALIHGDRIISWPEMSKRSNNLARDLRAQGAGDGAKIAFYMRNRSEYGELMAACFKGRLTHVNINYRYRPEEVFYIFDDSDSEVIVYSSEFRDCILELKERLTKVHTFVEIGDASQIASFALPYEKLVEGNGAPLDIERSPDDLLFIYTGGTTGMPKGVMWRQGDVYVAQMGGAKSDGTPIASIAEAVDRAVRFSGASVLPTPPFMHGAGLYSAFRAFHEGTRVVIQSDPRHFDPDDVLATAEAAGVRMVLLIGDAFGRPILEALRRGRYRLPKLRHFINTGAVLSESVKQGLYEAVPGVAIIDSLGSSETGTQAEIITRAGTPRAKADFAMLDDLSVVVSADARRLLSPGDPDIGWLARRGFLPRGFLGDRAKTEATFPVLDGVRYVVGGDRVRYRADGGLDYLGRDSVTINSGGEKIFAEEVEQALLSHPAVEDVVVAGRPSERWGSEVVAIVALRAGVEADREALLAEAGRHVARYKLPKAFIFVPRVERHPNGKHNYRWARAVVEQAA